MTRQLRVFVSSTMRDLRNERAEVVKRLKEFRLDPVHAEGWMPTGQGGWERIQDEIESSDIFVLIVGDTYGFVPSDAPTADNALSVTHLEFLHARSVGLPILPFIKKVADDTDRTSTDALRRDAFRREIEAWSGGYVRAMFDLAADLADQVSASIVELLSDAFRRQAILARKTAVRRALPRLTSVTSPQISHLIDGLATEVQRGNIVLYAGAEMSVDAGMPSTAFMAQYLRRYLVSDPADYSFEWPEMAFDAAVNEFLYSVDDSSPQRILDELWQSFSDVHPTRLHRVAVRLFDTIVTPTFDSLLSQAAADEGTGHGTLASRQRSWGERYSEAEPDAERLLGLERVILQLRGTMAHSNTPLFTMEDFSVFRLENRRLWSMMLDRIGRRDLLVVGSSLRDPFLQIVMRSRESRGRTWIVSPEPGSLGRLGFRRDDLRVIQATPDDFMAALASRMSLALRDEGPEPNR